MAALQSDKRTDGLQEQLGLSLEDMQGREEESMWGEPGRLLYRGPWSPGFCFTDLIE